MEAERWCKSFLLLLHRHHLRQLLHSRHHLHSYQHQHLLQNPSVQAGEGRAEERKTTPWMTRVRRLQRRSHKASKGMNWFPCCGRGRSRPSRQNREEERFLPKEP